jgi:hypothetical protein
MASIPLCSRCRDPTRSKELIEQKYRISILPSVAAMTPGRMRILEGGEERFSDLSPGVAYFRPAGVEHDVFNGGDQELIFVEIELVR